MSVYIRNVVFVIMAGKLAIRTEGSDAENGMDAICDHTNTAMESQIPEAVAEHNVTSSHHQRVINTHGRYGWKEIVAHYMH